jgi:hypothetical protein
MFNSIKKGHRRNCLVQVFHSFSDFRRFRIWKRKTDHDDAPAEVIAEIDTFAHFATNDAEEQSAIL